MKVSVRRCSIAAVFAALTSIAAAQVVTGTYPFGTFDNKGIDSIDLGNLNVHLTIPIINKPGRGLPFYYNLSYDSSVWYPTSVNGSTVWQPVQNFGWRGQTEIATGYVSYHSSTTNGRIRGTDGLWYTCPTTMYSAFVYHDTFGIPHGFGGITIDYDEQPPECNPPTSTPSFTANATDGSGYSLSVTNFHVPTLTAPATFSPVRTKNMIRISSHGAQVNAPTGPSGSGQVIDSNGNEISANGTGGFTDTLGKNALSVSSNGSTQTSFTYTDTTGASRTVQMNYTAMTVQTSFGCPNIGEYGPIGAYLVSSIVLPDGSTYTIHYEQTLGVPGNVTGRIASITLPQGGTINYGYSNGITGAGLTSGSNGIMCADGSTSGLTRSIVADSGSAASTWTYLRATSSSTASETQVTDGLGNYSDYNFIEAANQPTSVKAEYYEISRSLHSGGSSGPVQLSRTTCYNLSTRSSATCSPGSFSLPITAIDTYETFDGIQERGSAAVFDQYGELTDHYIYDFASTGSRGGLLRHEQWAYGAGIVGLPTSDLIYDGSGTLSGKALMTYDTGTLAISSGIPQHVAVNGPRGNLTGDIIYTGSSSNIGYSATYEDTGDVLTSTFQPSTVSWTGNYSYDSTHAYATQYTPPTPSSGVSLPISATTDATTGLRLTTTDANGTKLSNSYDFMLRPSEVDAYDGSSNQVGKTSFVYPSANQIGVWAYQNGTSFADTEILYDAYGRFSRVAVNNGQGGNPWYQEDSCYDANDNVTFTSYRYQGNGWGTGKVCSGSGDSYTYDALGRLTWIGRANGTAVNYSYSGRAMKTTDENGVSRIVQVDGLGRITNVCEVSSHSDVAGNAPAACGLDISGTGFATTYAYNLASHTTTVTQGTQTRTFTTDWIGRPTTVIEPESGRTTYSYAYNSTGLVATRIRPQANQTNSAITTTTTYQFDALGRLVSASYTDSTPMKNFYYDLPTMYGGATAGASKGRLNEVSVSVAGNWAGTAYRYDAMGRVIATDECLPSGCGNAAFDKWSDYTYDWTGNLLSQSDPASGTISYTRSVAGEVTSVTNQTYSLTGSAGPGTLVSSVQNGPNGPASWSLGNGLTGARYYDAVGNLSSAWLCNGSSAVNCSGGTMLYGFDTDFAGSRLLDMCDSALNQCASAGRDDIGRLTSFSVTAGNPGSYNYTYDRWGNRWQQSPQNGGLTENLSFDSATNRITSAGFSYDAAGNLLSDGYHSYTYDADGNIVTADTNRYYHDALNRKIRTDYSGGTVVESVYDQAGHITSDWFSPTSVQDSRIYWDYGALAFRVPNGTTFFVHKDWVNNDRVHTDPSGAAAATFSSLPFGDGGSTTVNEPYGDWNFHHFGDLDYNGETDTNHAQYRQYSPAAGRWMSPDPYSGSYDFANPQSLNRYAYVLNNPMALIDPSGLAWQYDPGQGCFDYFDDQSQTLYGCLGLAGSAPSSGSSGGSGAIDYGGPGSRGGGGGNSAPSKGPSKWSTYSQCVGMTMKPLLRADLRNWVSGLKQAAVLGPIVGLGVTAAVVISEPETLPAARAIAPIAAASTTFLFADADTTLGSADAAWQSANIAIDCAINNF